MTKSENTSLLSFNGAVIQDRGDMLSLTDMWRAAGGDEAKRPAEWLRQDATKMFVEVVAGTLDVGHAHIYSKRGGRGIGGVTFAHWQIGLAYAKYLSPEFHMWCNTVVRERMEGGRVPVGFSLDAEARRTIGGIVKSVIHSELQTVVAHEVEAALAADPRRAVLAYVSVRQLLDEAKALTKGRRSLNRRVGNELRNRAVLAPPTQPVAKCPHSGVWLFPRDFAAGFMAERGAEMVKAHNDKIRGQGVLKLVPTRREDGPSPTVM